MTREQRAAYVAWHELTHRALAVVLCHLVWWRGWFILAKRASMPLHQPRVRQLLLPRLYIL